MRRAADRASVVAAEPGRAEPQRGDRACKRTMPGSKQVAPRPVPRALAVLVALLVLVDDVAGAPSPPLVDPGHGLALPQAPAAAAGGRAASAVARAAQQPARRGTPDEQPGSSGCVPPTVCGLRTHFVSVRAAPQVKTAPTSSSRPMGSSAPRAPRRVLFQTAPRVI